MTITTEGQADESRTSTSRDFVREFIEAATMPSRELKMGEMKDLRHLAIQALNARFEAQLRGEYEGFTPELAESVEDPAVKFIMLGELGNNAWGFTKYMDALRKERRSAILVLVEDYDYKPMMIVRAFNADPKHRRMVDFAVNPSDKRTRPKGWTEERARRTGLEAHRKYMLAKKYGLETRPMRDRMVIDMTEGHARDVWGENEVPEGEPRAWTGGPRKWSNAELARLAGMSTAAIAQIRTGTAPSAKRAAREAESNAA